MAPGLMGLIVIVAIIITYFFGFKILGWCILLGISIFLCVAIYELLDTEGKTKVFRRWRKRMWDKYLKIEARFFKWLDDLF